MMRTLHKEKGATLRIEILTEPSVQNFITTHADTLDNAFKTVPMSDAMRRRLQRSDYIFSGIKTFHEINEAFPSLLNTDGTRKPFTQFLEEVKHIDKTYNQHYLAAEFNFAQASAAMAAKWEQYAQDGDRYLLQYRTAGDDRVRPEHASLEGVTLPITDTFWEEFYPPNGWNCRCTVTQVLKSQATPTPHEQAIALGEDALQLDKHRFFRHNSGITGKTFPDYNPYTIQRCRDCDIAKGKLKLGKPSNEVCEACQIFHKCAGDKSKSENAIERIHYLHEMEPLLKLEISMPTKTSGESIKVGFTKRGNKHLYSDTLGRSRILQKDDLKTLSDILSKATYIDDKSVVHKYNIKHFYYYEATLHGQKIRLNVAKEVYAPEKGRKKVKHYLYSINDIKNKH